MTALPPVAILAGGRGTRLGELVRDTPKPLLEVAGEPFLFHQLRLLAEQGACRVVLCVGYLGEVFERTLGRSRFGLDFAYVYDDEPGTALALRRSLPLLGDEFLVVYGDAYLPLDYAAAVAARSRSSLPALMTVTRWRNGNAEVADGRVTRYDKSARLPWLDWGVQVMTPAALDVSAAPDLPEVQTVLAAAGLLAAHQTTERFHEIGTPAGLREAKAFLSDSSPPPNTAEA